MSDEIQTGEAQAEAPKAEAPITLQRLYTKDISFETPNSPAIFQKEWKPEIKLDLDTRSNTIAEKTFEVTLVVTVTATVEGQTAFLAEVQQAGIFSVGSDVPEAHLAHMIGAYCPNTLFPYARETVSNLVNRGSFPQLNLAPVNFDALFASYVQQRQAKAEQEAASAETH